MNEVKIIKKILDSLFYIWMSLAIIYLIWMVFCGFLHGWNSAVPAHYDVIGFYLFGYAKMLFGLYIVSIIYLIIKYVIK